MWNLAAFRVFQGKKVIVIVIVIVDKMPMPEATIHKDARSVFPQHNVRVPSQPRMIQPIAKTTTPQLFTHNNLRLRVFGTNARHVIMPLIYG